MDSLIRLLAITRPSFSGQGGEETQFLTFCQGFGNTQLLFVLQVYADRDLLCILTRGQPHSAVGHCPSGQGGEETQFLPFGQRFGNIQLLFVFLQVYADRDHLCILTRAFETGVVAVSLVIA